HEAKKLGIYTLVTDWYNVEDSPAKQIADEFFMTSTSDIDAMVKLIKEENIDGVITGFTDSVLPYYAEICEKSGLPYYGTKEQFEIITNKTKYKEKCQQFGVPVVEEYDFTLNDLNSIKEQDVKFPVLVKPSDGSGAKGVFICNNLVELIDGYKRSLEYSNNKEILVERYVSGKEVTVFYLLDNGEIYLTGMGNRHVKHNQEGIIPLPVAYTFPSIHLKRYIEEIDPKVKDMFESLQMKNGMVFMQCLVEDGECIIYDIGYRLTGSLEYKLLDEIYGYNLLQMLIRFSLTGKMSNQSISNLISPNWERYAWNVSFLMKPGTIKKIDGLDSILQKNNVIDAVLAHREGETLPNSAKG